VAKIQIIPQLHFIKRTSQAKMVIFGDGADDEDEEDRAQFYSQVKYFLLQLLTIISEMGITNVCHSLLIANLVFFWFLFRSTNC
jgi:hypothetical protein